MYSYFSPLDVNAAARQIVKQKDYVEACSTEFQRIKSQRVAEGRDPSCGCFVDRKSGDHTWINLDAPPGSPAFDGVVPAIFGGKLRHATPAEEIAAKAAETAEAARSAQRQQDFVRGQLALATAKLTQEPAPSAAPVTAAAPGLELTPDEIEAIKAARAAKAATPDENGGKGKGKGKNTAGTAAGMLVAAILLIFSMQARALDNAVADRVYNVIDLDNRACLVYERFEQKPGIAADVSSATLATLAITNRNWKVSGTNSASSGSAFSTTGQGVKLTTAGADGDQMILSPHTATNQTSLNATNATGSSYQPRLRTRIRTGSSIAATIIQAGLQLTTALDSTTDDDAVRVRYSSADTISTTWQVVVSRAGTEETYDTGVTVAADTEYTIDIQVASDRTVQVFINGKPSGRVFAAIVASKALLPVIGVQANGAGAAKSAEVRYIEVSRVATQ